MTPKDESDISVDNIKVAQFVYLILNNEELRNVIDTIASKAVLILGRFTPARKQIPETLRVELRQLGYVPILFDFKKPKTASMTETVSTLAHLARFVVADLTAAKSVPQELQRIVPDLPSLPIQPIILSSEHPWAMFEDLERRQSVLPLYRYPCADTLLSDLETKVVGPAEKWITES